MEEHPHVTLEQIRTKFTKYDLDDFEYIQRDSPPGLFPFLMQSLDEYNKTYRQTHINYILKFVSLINLLQCTVYDQFIKIYDYNHHTYFQKFMLQKFDNKVEYQVFLNRYSIISRSTFDKYLLQRLFFKNPTIQHNIYQYRLISICIQLYLHESRSHILSDQDYISIQQFLYIYTSFDYDVHDYDLIYNFMSNLFVLLIFMPPFYFKRYLFKLIKLKQYDFIRNPHVFSLIYEFLTAIIVDQSVIQHHLDFSNLINDKYVYQNLNLLLKKIKLQHYGMQISQLTNYFKQFTRFSHEFNQLPKQKENEYQRIKFNCVLKIIKKFETDKCRKLFFRILFTTPMTLKS